MIRYQLLALLVERGMMLVQGCTTMKERPLSGDEIDKKRGLINVYEMLPEKGDMITVVNCGSHYEIRHQHLGLQSGMYLTDEDIENLKQGSIVWN